VDQTPGLVKRTDVHQCDRQTGLRGREDRLLELQPARAVPAHRHRATEDLKKLDELVSTRRRFKRGDHLYRAGQGFESIYAVRSGFFKTDVLIEDGRDQVTGFQMTGELLGLDGISSEVHTCNAIALEDSEVCAIPFSHLEGLSREIHTLQHHFHKVMSREIVRDHGVMMLLGTMRAEERSGGLPAQPFAALQGAWLLAGRVQPAHVA
jgi:CRP-like cAMP-binding protein